MLNKTWLTCSVSVFQAVHVYVCTVTEQNISILCIRAILFYNIWLATMVRAVLLSSY